MLKNKTRNNQKNTLWSHLSLEERKTLDDIQDFKDIIYKNTRTFYNKESGFNYDDWLKMLRPGLLHTEKRNVVRSHVIFNYLWAEQLVNTIIICHFAANLPKKDLLIFREEFLARSPLSKKLRVASGVVPLPKEHLEMITELKRLRNICAHESDLNKSLSLKKRQGLVYRSPYDKSRKEKNILSKRGFGHFVKDCIKFDLFTWKLTWEYSLFGVDLDFD